MWPYFSSPCRFRGTGRSTSFRWRKRRRSPSPSSGAGAPVALPTPFLTHKVTQASSRLGRAFGGVLPPAAEQMQTSGRFPTEGRRTSKLRWSQPANYCWRPASTTLQPLEMELNFLFGETEMSEVWEECLKFLNLWRGKEELCFPAAENLTKTHLQAQAPRSKPENTPAVDDVSRGRCYLSQDF